jgi:hypothetical protein
MGDRDDRARGVHGAFNAGIQLFGKGFDEVGSEPRHCLGRLVIRPYDARMVSTIAWESA